MKAAAIAIVSAATLASILAATGPERAGASCAAGLTYHDLFYVQVNPTEDSVARGPFVGRGHLPPCYDTGVPANPDPGTPVRVYRAGKLDSSIALMRRTGQELFVGPYYLPQLSSHPLHRALYGDAPHEPDYTVGNGCGRRLVRVSGRVREGPGFARYAEVRLTRYPRGMRVESDRTTVLGIDANTKVSGPTRFGLPYVRAGRRFHARVLPCDALVVARSFVYSRR